MTTSTTKLTGVYQIKNLVGLHCQNWYIRRGLDIPQQLSISESFNKNNMED